jgi:putative SOS response-associated peptidase YedK
MLREDSMPVDEAPEDEGPHAPRQSYNFAPGYHGIVYRADVPDWGAGAPREHNSGGGSSNKKRKTANTDEDTAASAEQTPSSSQQQQHHDETESGTAAEHHDPSHRILQSMKWGLIPFWTKRNPGYGSLMKTINCRDDSLAQPGGMWASMKGRKRCIVVAQGFYEWLKVGPKEKVPHFVKRKDGRLMCLAGLWDCVRYDEHNDGDGAEYDRAGEKSYTYTIITTDSNEQLKFLHDRMPVILDPGSKEMDVWLDPGRSEWSKELQAVLKPYHGELEVYPVSKEVGKVGNNSPTFIVPVASKENKSNIANFFAKGAKKQKQEEDDEGEKVVEVEKKEEGGEVKQELESVDEVIKEEQDDGVKIETKEETKGRKREVSSPLDDDEPPAKKAAPMTLPVKHKPPSPVKKPPGRATRSATTNVGKSPAKGKGGTKAKVEGGSQKITKFFGNSA